MSYQDAVRDSMKEQLQMRMYLAKMMEDHNRNKKRQKKMTKKEYKKMMMDILNSAISDDGTSYRAMFAAGIGTQPRTDYDRITANDCHFWLEVDGKVFDPTPNPSPYEMVYKPFPIATQCRLARMISGRVKDKENSGELEAFSQVPKERSCWYNVSAWKKYHPDAKGKKARIVVGSAGFKIQDGIYWEYG